MPLGLEMVRTLAVSSHGLLSVTICVLISSYQDNSHIGLGLTKILSLTKLCLSLPELSSQLACDFWVSVFLPELSNFSENPASG